MDSDNYKKEIDKSEKLRLESIFPKLKSGFTFKPSGRCGYIYYKENGRLMEIYIEMSGVPQYHFLIWDEGLNHWVYPNRKVTSIDDKMRISNLLVKWLNKNNYKSDYSRQTAEQQL